jgi:hypothetical protein
MGRLKAVKMNKNLILLHSANNSKNLLNAALQLKAFTEFDILIIDDDTMESVKETLLENPQIKCIIYDTPAEFGSSLLSAFEYARDLEYNYLITLDADNSGYLLDMPLIIENLKYDFDIISFSRILENYSHEIIPEKYIHDSETITLVLKEISDLDITDPLSETKCFRISSVIQMELTEYTHTILLQIWIQAAHLGLSVIEIPSNSGETFGKEIDMYEDFILECLAVMETEKYLYPKGTIN